MAEPVERVTQRADDTGFGMDQGAVEVEQDELHARFRKRGIPHGGDGCAYRQPALLLIATMVGRAGNRFGDSRFPAPVFRYG